MFQLTISANSPEELLANLLSAVSSMKAGTTVNIVNTVQAEPEQPQDEETTAEPVGRRSARRGSENKAGEDAAQEPVSRRSREKKEELVNDNEEQAALRNQIIADLQILADDEKAHAGVQDALKRVGSKNVSEIPSALLNQFNDDIQALFPEENGDAAEAVEDDSALRLSLVADLKDLSDVIAAPEKPGEDKDVTDTLEKAWAAAGVKFRGKNQTDSNNLQKIPNDKLQEFGETVTKLIAKYFG